MLLINSIHGRASSPSYVDCAMQKRGFGHMRTAKAQITLCGSDQGFHFFSLTESLDFTEYMNGEQMPGWYLKRRL